VVLGAPIIIDKAEHYEKHLAEQKVVVSQQERRRLIVEGLDARAAELGGEWSDPGDVLAEAVYLAEWPSVARGALADGHLRLPAPVLITAMQSHQRYFPVRDGDGRLLPAFLYVSNADPRAADLVTRGNERVLEGRLDDAEFAYDRDVAEGLDTMADRLGDVVFHEKLGSLADKAYRLQGLVAGLAVGPGAEGARTGGNGSSAPLAETLRMAARLAKADLVSQVVIEFPVLQGVMGGIYAESGGLGDAIARAVGEHYRPLSATAPLPSTLRGGLLAVADKADNIVGAWVAGQKPSGSRDPYGLRRAAMGIVRIALEYSLRFPIAGLLTSAVDQFELQGAEGLDDERRRLGDDDGATFVVKSLGALQLELVYGRSQQTGDGEAQAVLERDAHDAHGRTPQAVRVARAGRLLAGDPRADDIVGLVGDGEEPAAQRARKRRCGRQRAVVLAHGPGDRVAQAARFSVDAAHDALQNGELDDHLTHEVGLGQPRGHAQRLGERGRRAVAAGARAFGAGPDGQTGHQPLQAVRLVGQGAELLVEHHVAEAVGHGVETLGDVAVVGKLGVVQPAFEHTLVAARDEIGRPGIGVAHVEERRQQAAVAVPHREVALMALHRRDEHGGRQPQVAVGERAAGNARPLGEVHRLGQHVARVGPLRAEIGGMEFAVVTDQAAALLLRDDHLLLRQVLLVVLGPVDDDGRAEHPVTLRHVAGGQAVERRLHRLAPELADQPADGTGEAQVLGLAGGTAAPAHPARDLQARDQSRDETWQDSGRVATLGLDADDGELHAADHLAAHVPGLGAARAREPQPGLGKAARGVVGDLDLGAAVVVGLGGLALGHALDQHGDAPRGDQHPEVGSAALEKALGLEELVHEPRRLGGVLELADHRLADLVGQLFAADLDEEGAHAPTTSRYWLATLRARSRTRPMCIVRSVTLITPRASSTLKVWLHLSTWS